MLLKQKLYGSSNGFLPNRCVFQNVGGEALPPVEAEHLDSSLEGAVKK